MQGSSQRARGHNDHSTHRQIAHENASTLPKMCDAELTPHSEHTQVYAPCQMSSFKHKCVRVANIAYFHSLAAELDICSKTKASFKTRIQCVRQCPTADAFFKRFTVGTRFADQFQNGLASRNRLLTYSDSF